MKKLAAVLTSVAMLLCFASCGGSEEAVSSEAASSNAPSNPASNIVISMPSIPEVSSNAPTVESDNLALADNATVFDNNENLEEGAEGYTAYYQGDLGPHSLDLAFDGDISTGWQMNDAPDGTGNMFIGVRFEEATAVDMIVLSWEDGSKPATFGTSFKVEYTLDGEEWVEFGADTYERVEGNPATVDTISFEAMDLKAFRVVLFEQGGSEGKNYTPKLFELEVFAPIADETVESADETVAE